MSLLEGSCREVLELAEVVTMVTMGPDGPHMTATWGDYVRTMGVGENRLVVPAGFYRVMEANLETNPGVQVLVASRGAQGRMGMGQALHAQGHGAHRDCRCGLRPGQGRLPVGARRADRGRGGGEVAPVAGRRGALPRTVRPADPGCPPASR